MLRRPLILALALAGILGAPGVRAQHLGSADLGARALRCESVGSRERHCEVDTTGGVRMVRQLSRSECVEGKTWGVEHGGIWVAQGCRAAFLAGRGGSEPDNGGNSRQVVRCESTSGRSNLCVMDTSKGVELVRQLSRNACIREQNWGWNQQCVWVSGGCRAEFRSRSDGDDDVGGGG